MNRVLMNYYIQEPLNKILSQSVFLTKKKHRSNYFPEEADRNVRIVNPFSYS